MSASKISNEFLNMKECVQKELSRYERIRKECHITERWKSETIKRLAAPFINGCFTLAVMGKMSSGKSTFINALIEKNILPTGHFQTTSVLTYIQHGPELLMKVIYCDDHEEIVTDNISKRLRELVAIPDEYNNLPINDINKLIAGEDSVEEILKKKEGIEGKTKCAIVDEKIWREYISKHTKANIAKEVYIECPLPDEFQGWRIVDTPGVGAVGGIQVETKILLATKDNAGNKKVDAVIFLHSGIDNIEDETARNFMEIISEELPEESKKRLFFVLTKAADTSFRTHKDETMKKAEALFTKPFGLSNDRLTYVDSLLYRFYKELDDKDNFDELDGLRGWPKDDFEKMQELYTPIKKLIRQRNQEMTNESINYVMKEWANFDELKKNINTFVRSEKTSTFERIKELIKQDCLGFIKSFQQQRNLLEGGKDAIERRKKEVQRNRIEYNKILNRLQIRTSTSEIWPKFGFIDERISSLPSITSIPQIRTVYLNLIEEVAKKESDIFKTIREDFEQYCKDYCPNDISLESIDFDELEKKAEDLSTEEVTDYSRPKEKLVKEGGLTSDPKYKTIYPYTKKQVDIDKKRREFAAYVITEARVAKQTYEKQLRSKAEHLHSIVKQEIDAKIKNVERNLDEIEKKLSDKDREVRELDSKIEIVNQYGYQ